MASRERWGLWFASGLCALAGLQACGSDSSVAGTGGAGTGGQGVAGQGIGGQGTGATGGATTTSSGVGGQGGGGQSGAGGSAVGGGGQGGGCPSITDIFFSAAWGCDCCSEGQSLCLQVTADDAGTITDVAAGSGNPTPEQIDCVEVKLLGVCIAEAGEQTEACAYGV